MRLPSRQNMPLIAQPELILTSPSRFMLYPHKIKKAHQDPSWNAFVLCHMFYAIWRLFVNYSGLSIYEKHPSARLRLRRGMENCRICRPAAQKLLTASETPVSEPPADRDLSFCSKMLAPICQVLELCAPKLATFQAQCWRRGWSLGQERNNASEEEMPLPLQKQITEKIRKRKARVQTQNLNRRD